MGARRTARGRKSSSQGPAELVPVSPVTAPILQSRSLTRNALVVLMLVMMVYVGLALTPSHYQLGLRRLGVESQPLLGTARQIRTDEWMVLTPMTQLAVRGGFKPEDQVSPYGQSLRGFIALPIADWSLAFKPQLWAYWILPPAYAYSMYWAILWGGMLSGYALLLRLCGVPMSLAVLGSVILWMSHFVQVWWTGPAPAFALAPWPAVILLSQLRTAAKCILVPYAAAVWMFGVLYPPYQIPTVLALGALALGLRRDVISLRSLVVVVGSGCAVLAIGYAYLHDVIEVMRSTVYPGSRVSSGGGLSSVQLASHVLPYLSTFNFAPLIGKSNECEVAVVSTALPLLLLCCIEYRSLSSALRQEAWPLCIIGGTLALMFAWIALPIPSVVGRVLLWHYVPPYRMTWAFGMLLTLAAVALLARVNVRFSLARVAVFCAGMLVSWLVGQRWSMDLGQRVALQAFDWFELAAIACICLAWVAASYLKRTLGCDDRLMLGVAAAAAGIVTFGTFNPVQQAHDIFEIPPSARQEEFRAQARANPNGWLVTPGMYGAILNGAGIPAINHCLPAPQLEFFRAVFPEIAPAQFNDIFNRYANVMVRSDGGARLLQEDAVVVPMAAFMQPQPQAAAIGKRQRDHPGQRWTTLGEP